LVLKVIHVLELWRSKHLAVMIEVLAVFSKRNVHVVLIILQSRNFEYTKRSICAIHLLTDWN